MSADPAARRRAEVRAMRLGRLAADREGRSPAPPPLPELLDRHQLPYAGAVVVPRALPVPERAEAIPGIERESFGRVEPGDGVAEISAEGGYF